MTNVVELDHRKLRIGDYCFSERVGDGSFGTFAECWTSHDLNEVCSAALRANFFSPMIHAARPGDLIECYRVIDTERPSKDPLEMRTFIVTLIENGRHGPVIRTEETGRRIVFGSSPGEGVHEGLWDGKFTVHQDGRRVGVYLTRVEAIEAAERLRNSAADGLAKRVNQRLKEWSTVPVRTVELPRDCSLRHEDIAAGPPRKVSRVLEVKTLSPIADCLGDPQWTHRVASRFKTNDRVSIMRFSNDARSALVEMLGLVLVDVSAHRVRFHPQSEIVTTGWLAESGWVKDTIGGRYVLRFDGVTREAFESEQRRDWFCTDHNIIPGEPQRRKAAAA